MSEEQFICARCGMQGETCCQNSQVFVSAGDVRRVTEFTGRGDFYEIAPLANPRYQPEEGIDPLWARVFNTRGERRVLAHRDGRLSGDCVFLGEKGCALPLAVRPLVCRLYPYEYDGSTLKGVSAHLCPPPERDNTALILALLGMNREEAEGWRQLLYQEIEREFPE